ncbi:hypothetical protein [Enterococcus rivorum]|uniref:hypothetical protein n=1 Tax=Enterococcus rivorum TaxID=762845 RepID=UPI001B8092E0|nr:hypothetical protein [Enterococcus rivorum]
MTKYLEDFFCYCECNGNSFFEHSWKITTNKSAQYFEKLNLMKIIIKQSPEPFMTVYYSGEKKIIGLVLENSLAWQVQNVIRFIRIVIRLQQKEDETIFFHGGFIKYKNKGICFLGDKKCGKTSSILSFLRKGNVSFISNDDVSLNVKGPEIIGFGWPRSIVVRNDTLDKLNVNLKIKLAHPLNEKHTADVTCFYPKELCQQFEVPLLSEFKVDYVVFPEFKNTEYPIIQKLDHIAGSRKLQKNIQSVPGKYIDFLLPYFSKNLKELNLNKFKENDICLISLNQSFDDLNAGSEALIKFIEQEGKSYD